MRRIRNVWNLCVTRNQRRVKLAPRDATASWISFRQSAFEKNLFDIAFYESHSPDAVEAGMNCFEHFCRYGWQEGRWPNPAFDTTFYRTRHLGGDASINRTPTAGAAVRLP